SNWHQKQHGEPVLLDYRSYGGGAGDTLRYFQSSEEFFKKTGTYKVDLVWGGGDFLFDVQLRKQPGYLQPVKISDAIRDRAFPRPDLAGVPLYNNEGYWYGTALSSFGIVYNRDVLRKLGLDDPKTWADLADPKYRGWLVMADPTRSFSAKTAF